MELARALFTCASLTFQTGTNRSLPVLISILYPGSVGRAVKRLAADTLPNRILQSIHLIRSRNLNHASNFDASSASLQYAPTDNSSIIKIFTLNVQRTITNKLAPLQHFIEFHEFPELLCLQEIGTTIATFRFHPLYEPFFSVGVRKCLGVVILIHRVASFSYFKAEVRPDGRGVAVWFSLYALSLMIVRSRKPMLLKATMKSSKFLTLWPSPMGYGFKIMAKLVRKWTWTLLLLLQCQSP